MPDEQPLPACERFTVLDIRHPATPPRCDVCDQPEGAHPTIERRIVSGGEIEALRRQMLIERFTAEHGDDSTRSG